MIPLPPGCQVSYSITIEIDRLTDEIGEWFIMIGGRAWAEEEWDHRGRRQLLKFVQYGKSKRSHVHKNGSDGVRIHFDGADASVASMFLIKFNDQVRGHNLKEFKSYEY